MSAWLALTLELDGGAAEAFSEALLQAGAQSVTLEAAAPDWRRERLTALLEPAAPIEALVEAAARAAGVAAPCFTVSAVADQDWVRQSQAQFAPLAIGKRLWVGPSWSEPPTQTRAVVRLDPGLAFGTGSHASTRLVLEFLDKQIRGTERVLDYGCGSGILAIAAAKLGAVQVDAVDIDPQAVEITAANARANGVAVRALAPEAFTSAPYDIVVSNILAQPLVVLAPLLAACTALGGRIALSGVLDRQADEVKAAYAPFFDIDVSDSEQGWVLVAGMRR